MSYSIAAAALGMSGACFLDPLLLVISPRHDVVYHLVGSVWVLFLPLVLNVLALAALFVLVLAGASRFERLNRVARAGLLCFLPWILAKNISYLRGTTFSHHQSSALFAGCALATVILGLGPWGWSWRAFEATWRAGRAVLAIGGCVVAVTLVQVLCLGFAARHLNDGPQSAEVVSASVAPPHGRVLWIVLDELGYEQVYGHRLSGLALPNFDALAAQSTVFTGARPAGMFTEFILPSLITGRNVTSASATASGRKLTLVGPSGAHLPFDAKDTVFADADALGYRSGVVGWYNPYCRILPSVLADCYWTGQTELSDLFPAHRFWPNLFHPLLRVLHKIPAFLHHPAGASRDEMDEGKLHIEDFVNLDKRSDAALHRSADNFILLHMPIPHPTGIWDRHTHSFAVDHSCYVDNLALADDYLGKVRSTLEAQGEWDDATVVVMGDHAWRTTLLWRGQPAWKADDQQASHGGAFDTRPAYIVKLPGQTRPSQIGAPFAAQNTRLLLDELLAHSIRTPEQLQAWFADAPQPTGRP